MNIKNSLTIISVAVTTVLALLSSNAIAMDDTQGKQLERQAIKGDASSLQQLQQSSQTGDAVAEFWMGVYLEEKKQYPEAMTLLRKAAVQRLAEAQNELGNMYSKGLGVAQNVDNLLLGLQWYSKAAIQGLPEAQFNMGVMAEALGKGEGYAQAVQWYRRAADQGYADAQNNLGDMYKNGEHVHQNHVIAYALYNLASSDNTTALSNRDGLIKDMSEQEITAGQSLTQKMTSMGVTQAIDEYSRKEPKPIKRKSHKTTQSTVRQEGGQWPARPVYQPGVTSCNTQCTNGDCYRTYDNGRHVHLNVPPSIDPFTNEMKFETPPC